MRKINILFGALAISILLIFSMFSGTAIKMSTITLGGKLEVEKKVFDGQNWVDSIEAELDDIVKFKITMTYYKADPGEHYAYDIVVTDELPLGLEYEIGSSDPFEPVIEGKTLTWDLEGVILNDTESFVINFDASVSGCEENYNLVKVEAYEYCTYQYFTSGDQALVNVECEPSGPPNINVEKYVWDGYCEWVEQIHVYNGANVRFRIVVTNTGEQVLSDVTVIDVLSDSLVYADQSTVNGEPCEPEISDGGSKLTWAFPAMEIGEEIIIEFTAIADGDPCEEDVNNVYVSGEGECDDLVTDEDDASVFIDGMCMDKQVWNEEHHGWMDESTVGEGEEIKFRITVWYYGGYKLYNIKIWDVLPPCIDYADDATVNGVPYEPEVSGDGKTIWWNLSSEYVLLHGTSLIIEFTALAILNNCQPSVNWAYIHANECSGKTFDAEDSATVYIECAFEVDAGGPYYGDIGEDITITGDATGGLPPYSYAWDIDNDGTYDDVTGKTITWSWSESGDYVVNLQVTDDEGEKAYDYAYVQIAQPENHPPNKPNTPNGPTSGSPGTLYSFSTSTTDPDGDDILYRFDWGDGTTSGWLGPYPSADTVIASHIYTIKNSYNIKVQAKDMPWFEDSELSEALTIKISISRTLIPYSILLKILGKLIVLSSFLENLILK